MKKTSSLWPAFSASDICVSIFNGSTPKSDKMDLSGEIPFVKVYNLTFDGSLDFSKNPTFISRETHENSLTRSIAKPGDVLINIVGPPMGKISVLPDTYPEWNFNQAIVGFRVLDCLQNHFLKYFLVLQGEEWGKQSSKATVGQFNISVSSCRGLEIPLPPLNEQRRIVAKLDAIFARTRAAKERLAKIPALLEKLKQSVLASAFRGDLTKEWREKNPNVESTKELLSKTPLPPRPSRYASRSDRLNLGEYALSVGHPQTPTPPKWEWVPLVDVARMESGHTPSREHPEYWGGNVSWIGIKDARNHHGKTIYETEQKTNELGLANSAARLLPKGTVCLSRTASVGYVVVMGTDMATSQDFVNWTCTAAINAEWLKYLLMAENESIWKFGKGTTHTTVYFPEVLSFHVCLPPIGEQNEIVQRIERRLALIENTRQQLLQMPSRWEAIEKAALSKAFRGELVPQDASDEPASVLLERIRAERQATESTRKKPRSAPEKSAKEKKTSPATKPQTKAGASSQPTPKPADANSWIPASAGMTEKKDPGWIPAESRERAGMTERRAGMTEVAGRTETGGVGMTEVAREPRAAYEAALQTAPSTDSEKQAAMRDALRQLAEKAQQSKSKESGPLKEIERTEGSDGLSLPGGTTVALTQDGIQPYRASSDTLVWHTDALVLTSPEVPKKRGK